MDDNAGFEMRQVRSFSLFYIPTNDYLHVVDAYDDDDDTRYVFFCFLLFRQLINFFIGFTTSHHSFVDADKSKLAWFSISNFIYHLRHCSS